ncbi:MAG: CFI-box-CTERM domain-containing protein, partial [Planctomycetota bacterium]
PLTDATPMIGGLEPAPTEVNYFMGDNPKNWRTNIRSYNLITLGEVWKGVTLNLKANSRNIEKLFIVAPDGNPESIRFSIEGIEKLAVSQTGELELKTLNKSIGFTSPVAYQEINGQRKPVDVSFRLIDKTTYGFAVGAYDRTLPLVIDPLLSSTFIGGFGTDIARALVIDPTNGNVFVAGYSTGIFVWVPGRGWVSQNNFPTQGQTPLNPYDSSFNGGTDIVVCKLNPSLTTLIASTFIGTSAADVAYGIAMDGQGNVFVCGTSGSGFFPILTDRAPIQLPDGTQFTPTAFDTSYNGPSVQGSSVNPNDAVVCKLSNSLNALLASTYLGGSASGSLTADSAQGIVIDENNNVFVCGYTDGSNFPTTGGPNYTNGASSVNYNGRNDGFIVKLNNNLSGPTGRQGEFYFAGIFIGGSGSDLLYSITRDEEGEIYVCGSTTAGSPYLFPVQGSGLEDALDRDIDSDGFTTEGVVCRFSNDLRTLRASTYLGGLGGVGPDVCYALTIGAPVQGLPTVYVTGTTDSPTFPIISEPTWNPYGVTEPGLGSQDIFIARLNRNLTRLLNSTWIGGVDTETSYSITTGGSNNNIYVCGTAESSDFPTTEGAFAITNTGGAGDVFVSAFNETLTILNGSTMIGGQFLDTAYCIRPDNSGNIILCGVAGDNAYPTWPTTGTNVAYDTSYNGSGDIFVTRISPDMSGGFLQEAQPTPPGSGEPYPEGEGIIVGSSALAYLDPNAFRQSCFIATAVYGNPMHPNVVALRNFRDKYLLTNKPGSAFVKWYYRTSPPIAEYLKKTPLQASAVRLALTPLVYAIRYPFAILLITGLLSVLIYRQARRRRITI